MSTKETTEERIHHLLSTVQTAAMVAEGLSQEFEATPFQDDFRYSKTLNIMAKELRAILFVAKGLNGQYTRNDWQAMSFDIAPPQSGSFFWGSKKV